jgi:16S rRNA processing protein RimM
MGRVVGPFGVRGWLKVQPFSARVDALAAFPEWWMGRDGSWTVVRVEQAQAHGSYLVAEIDGCRSPEEALRWRGADVAVERAQLAPAAPGEYYWADLEGVEVRNAQGERLGAIAEVFTNGAHEVLRVREQVGAEGSVERLIPFVPAVVLSVSLEERLVRVAWERDW